MGKGTCPSLGSRPPNASQHGSTRRPEWPGCAVVKHGRRRALEKSGHNPFATRSHTPPLPHSLTRTLGVGSNILKRCVFGDGIYNYCVAVPMPFLGSRSIAVPLSDPSSHLSRPRKHAESRQIAAPPVSLFSRVHFVLLFRLILYFCLALHSVICFPPPPTFHITTSRHATSIFHTQTKNNHRI